jgi:signal transduction histidine kinase
MHRRERWLLGIGFTILSSLAPLMLVDALIYQIGSADGSIEGQAVVRWATAAGVVVTFWLFTGVLLLRRFEQRIVRLLFVHGQVLSVTMVTPLAFPGPWAEPPGILRLSIAGFYTLAPLTVHMHLTFPVTLGSKYRRRQFLGALYAAAFASMLAWLVEQPTLRQIGEFYTITVFTTSIAILVYAYFFKATPYSRRRLRIIWFGTLLGIVPANVFYFVPGLYGLPTQIPVWMVGLLLVIMPVSYLYVITRENLFGIDRLLNRSLVYILLASGILLICLVPLVFIYNVLSIGWLGQAIVSSGITLVVGWNFIWLRTRIEHLVGRLFYGGWYDYPQVVDKISDALARSLTRERVTEVLTQQVPDLMRLYPGELTIGQDIEGGKTRITQPALEFRFHLQDGFQANWYARGHQNGEDFSSKDRRILNTLATQAEIALNNVILVEALRRQLEEIRSSRATLSMIQRQLLRSREEERSRLARELHDGPLQILIGMNIQMGLLSQNTPSSLGSTLHELRAEVRDLLDNLRAVCTELRPPMLDTLGLGAALRALAADWSQQHDMPLELDLPQDDNLHTLPDEKAVNFYRVAQEALVNIARHAGAKNVIVRLKKDESHYELSICDDGCGFNLPDNLHELAVQNHFGLVGIQERAELIGGQLAVWSEPGQGTVVQIRM